MSIRDVKIAVQNSAQSAESAGAMLAAANAQVTTAVAALGLAMDGTDRPEPAEIKGRLLRVNQQLQDANTALANAVQGAKNFASSL
ncbi:hypothetical protein [Micromonospora sp. CPCC 205561]|uniref:hypothetical protein n=1 Tax=Micromonospora sp. CPCC 205561 TaxID=3122407 RepID=UPI002FF28BF4